MEVWTAIDRMLRISTFFGLSQIHSANRPEIRTWRTVYSITVACALIAVFPLQIQVLQSLEKIRNHNLSQKICRGIYSLGHLFGALLAVVNSIRMRKMLRNFLTDCRGLVNPGLEIRIRGYVLTHIVFFTGHTVFNFDELAEELNWNQWREVDMVIESLAVVYHMLMVIQFAIFALAISAKITEMKNNLDAYLKGLLASSSANLKIKPENCIQRCRILYMDLSQQAEVLNKIFATTNLWIIFNMSFIVTYMLYNRLVKIRHMLLEGDMKRTMYILEMIFWSFYGIMIILGILLPCDEIWNKVLELKRTIKRHLVRATCRELIHELKQFADLLESEKIKFSLYGLFTLRKKMILTIAGLSVTYVAIISQMPEKIHKHAEQ